MTEDRTENAVLFEIKKLLDSEGLVAARLVESVTRTAQMAATTVPEIQDLFSQWLSLIGGEVVRLTEASPEIDIPATAKMIGIDPSSLLSILLLLHRRGRLSVETVRIGKGTGKNNEICTCLLDTEEGA